MLLLQLSAAQGPAECQLAVAKALRCLVDEATRCSVDVQVVEQEPGERDGIVFTNESPAALIGKLFTRVKDSKVKTELVFFITPHILRKKS